MTYGFAPENWPAFQIELQKRGIAVDDIERVELRPASVWDYVLAGRASEIRITTVDVTVRLRSGRVESWRQRQNKEE